jgi:hypothetical protein
MAFAVQAQQLAIPVIGYLGITNAEDEGARLNAFRQGIGEAGFIEGKNVLIEYRWPEGHYDRYTDLVADLVKRRVTLITTLGNSTAAVTAKAATATIPIVFAVGDDPITLGLVVSLNQPGSNATGTHFLTAEVVAKRLGLLRELLPKATRVAVLLNPGDVARAEYTRRELDAAAPGLGFQLEFFSATTSQEINDVFANLGRDRFDALFVGPDPFFNPAANATCYFGCSLFHSGELRNTGVRRGGRIDELRNQHRRLIPGSWHLCGKNSERRQASGSPSSPLYRFRAYHQHSNGKGIRNRGAAFTSCPRRRGDRMSNCGVGSGGFGLPGDVVAQHGVEGCDQ